MSFLLFLRLLVRESRGALGRLLLLSLSVGVGVTAVVGVDALVASIELGIRHRSREMLGGDLAIESRRPLPDLTPFLPDDMRRAPRVDLTVLSTMVRTDVGNSSLSELKAIDQTRAGFPLAGELLLAPRRPLAALLDDESALVAPELQAKLSLKLGDNLYVGGQKLRVTGVIESEPDPIAFAFSFGPRVIVTRAMLERTQLLAFGNRTKHRAVFSLARASEARLRALKKELEHKLPGGGAYVSVETHAEAQPALRSTLDRVQRYVGLVALLSLLLASVGVAQSVSGWLAEVTRQTAILRCLGLLPREVFVLYLGHVLLFSLLGSLAGGLLGLSLPWLLAQTQPQMLAAQVGLVVPPLSIVRGLVLGVVVPTLCSLGPLTAVWRASPASVLRSEAAPLPVPRSVTLAARTSMVLGVFGASWLESGDLRTALFFALGSASLAGLLWASARGLARLIARLPRPRGSVLVWHGLSAVARPGAGTTGSVVALGLGTLVVLTIALLETMLDRAIDTALPDKAPSAFLLDIQPAQWPAIEQLARELGASHIDSSPVVMARLSAIDGTSVQELMKQRPGQSNERTRGQWSLTREQRISWMKQLPADNQIVAGKLWSDASPNEVSVEAGFARDLDVHVGSTLRFDVQGVELDFKVTSLRTVQWRSFASNFFLVAEPGSLDDAPHFRFGAVRLSTSGEDRLQRELAERYPNVTVLRVHNLLARLQSVLHQAAVAVRILGAFAIVTGLVILIGAIAGSQLRRTREAALWKTLGLTRLQVLVMFAVEYALLGAVAGAIGAVGAYSVTALLARQLLQLDALPSWPLTVAAVLITIVLSVVCGLSASTKALLVRPLDVLRNRG